MAMCASGSLGIIAQPQGAGSSISCCVTGSASFPPYSLTTLSTTAGKTAPHAMTEFYSYVPPTWSVIDMLRTASVGTDGTSAAVAKVHCLRANPAMNTGDCYRVDIYINLCAIGQALGSYAAMCVVCNGTCLFSLCTTNGCLTPTCTVTPVDYNDTLLICSGACAANTACAGASAAQVAIYGITPIVGYECIGTTCTANCTWTG